VSQARPAWPRRAVLLLIAFTLAGCASLPGSEPPVVTVADVSFIDATLFEQRLAVKLRVQNPNDTELAIQGLTCEMLINDERFGSGVSGERVTIPRFGSGVVQVEVISTLGSLIRQFSTLQKGAPGGLRYRVRGTVSTGGSFGRLPFDNSGELALPGADDGSSKP